MYEMTSLSDVSRQCKNSVYWLCRLGFHFQTRSWGHCTQPRHCQEDFEDFSESETLSLPGLIDCVVFRRPDGTWVMQYSGYEITLGVPKPAPRGLGLWTVIQGGDGVCAVTDGVRTKLASNLVTFDRATLIHG